jgi:multidrug efflux pump subunit AcrB
MSDLRTEIKSKEPELDIEFVQILQDMINDLSNSPEPIQIKLFNDDPALLAQVGDEVATAIKKQAGVVDVLNGIENTVSGPSTTFRVNPSIASRLGFTAQEVATDASAVIEGEPAVNRLIQNGRPYTIRVRFADDHRTSLAAIQNTVLNSSSGKSATLGSIATIEQNPGEQEIRRENLQRNIAVTGRLEGTDLGSGIQRVQAAVAALHLPPSVRIQYGGAYEEQQKSFSELGRAFLLALALVFGVLLTEFRNLSAPVSILTSSILSLSGVILALLVT